MAEVKEQAQAQAPKPVQKPAPKPAENESAETNQKQAVEKKIVPVKFLDKVTNKNFTVINPKVAAILETKDRYKKV